MQRTLADAQYSRGSIHQPSQARAAGSPRSLLRLLLTVAAAFGAAIVAHRRYELLRSKGVEHERAIRQALQVIRG